MSKFPLYMDADCRRQLHNLLGLRGVFGKGKGGFVDHDPRRAIAKRAGDLGFARAVVKMKADGDGRLFRGRKGDLGTMKLEDFMAKLKEEVETKAL